MKKNNIFFIPVCLKCTWILKGRKWNCWFHLFLWLHLLSILKQIASSYELIYYHHFFYLNTKWHVGKKKNWQLLKKYCKLNHKLYGVWLRKDCSWFYCKWNDRKENEQLFIQYKTYLIFDILLLLYPYKNMILEYNKP